MAKAPKMVIVALVLSLLALPAFGVRGEGLEGISFSSQPLNPLDHRAAGLIEVEAGTGRRETENEDECDKELRSLENMFEGFCERHAHYNLVQIKECPREAKDTIKHSAMYPWQDHLVRTMLVAHVKTPVFWAGFWPGGEEGIDTRKALADFISSVNGFELADTEWGQAVRTRGANNLGNCSWDRKKNWWTVASMMMAKTMALHEVKHITIALHKALHGNYSFYKSILYQSELPNIGAQMAKKTEFGIEKKKKSTRWDPEFEVRSIAVKGAPPDESGCALASEVKYQLEVTARRPVTVWCKPCTTLWDCGDKQQVEKKSRKATCIGNCQNGQGTKTYAHGKKYQGEWKNGLRDGQGIETWADGSKYQGEWKSDLMVGQGTMTFSNGQIYQGQWKNGNMWGQGTYTYPDSEKYQGGWKKDLKNGQGTYTYPNGDKYQGRWKKDLRDGRGTMTLANGDKYEVLYKEGHLKKNVKKK